MHRTDACAGAEPEHEDWLWEAAVFGAAPQHRERARVKELTIDTRVSDSAIVFNSFV